MVDERGLVAPSDIADMAGVSRGAVSNWRKRSKDFPEPAAGTATNPLFDSTAVVAWLDANGKKVRARGADVQAWGALNALRSTMSFEDMPQVVLSMACARKLAAGDSRGDKAWRLMRDHVRERGFEVLEQVPSTQVAHGWDDLVCVTEAMRKVLPVTAHALFAMFDQLAPDSLAHVADYALAKISSNQIRAGVEHGFVGSRTSSLLANLTQGRTGILYDPACGIGAALLDATKKAKKTAPGFAQVVGHDIDSVSVVRARQRFYLHDVRANFTVGDVLQQDPDSGLLADTIILEPPFGLRWDSSSSLFDARFVFGTPPSSSADMAWIQHAISHLTPTGRGYVLSPMGTLFRGGQEKVIRTELVRRGCVEAVVGLPPKLLPHVSIPLALWVVCQSGAAHSSGEILLVDASEVDSPEDEVAGWLRGPSSDVELPPHSVSTIADVLAAEANLTPQRWIEAPGRDRNEVAEAYISGWNAIKETLARVQGTHRTLELVSAVPAARVLTLGELVDQGVLELKPGRPRDKEVALRPELARRVVAAADVRDGTLDDFDDPDEVLSGNADLTWPKDVLVTTMHKVRAIEDVTGGHLPSTGVYRLRITNTDQLAPEYLALVLTGSWNERFQAGSTIQRAAIRSLEVPLVPKKDQIDLRIATLAVRLLADEAAELATNAQTVGVALLDAVRYNAPLIQHSSDVGGIRDDGPDAKN